MSIPSPFDLEHLDRLWRQEQAASAARVVEARRETPLPARVAVGDALKGVSVDDSEAAPGDRTLLWLAGELEAFAGRPGDPLRLWWTQPDDAAAVRAVLARRRKGRLGVMVDGRVPDRLYGGRFNVDRDDPQATFARGRRALSVMTRARPDSDAGRLRAVLTGDRQVTVESVDVRPDPALNPSQQAAVRHALACRPVALIHGPPGTGKTRTLVEVVRLAVARGEKVLACATSNAATDNLAAQLVAAGLDVVRLGHPARVDRRVEDRTLDALLAAEPAHALARQWQAEARTLRDRAFKRKDRGADYATWRGLLRQADGLRRDARQQLERHKEAILDRTPVVCATAAGADTALLRDRRFDRVVLDEATQAPDPIALVALLRAPTAVLAGDPEQLPPTVIDPAAERAGLGLTLFERLAAREPARMLTVQYRMHADLMRFPSTTRYDGRLTADPAVATRTLADLGAAPDPARPGPLVMIDTAGKGWEETVDPQTGSVHNTGQAERTAAEVRRLVSRGVPPDGIGVLTPYRAQRRRLRTLLADLLDGGLEVNTVDAFQGREKDAVVLDLVRSNDAGVVGFVADRRRLNVALTRARRLLMVIADTATVGGHPDFAAFAEEAECQGGWLSAWSDDAEVL